MDNQIPRRGERHTILIVLFYFILFVSVSQRIYYYWTMEYNAIFAVVDLVTFMVLIMAFFFFKPWATFHIKDSPLWQKNVWGSGATCDVRRET